MDYSNVFSREKLRARKDQRYKSTGVSHVKVTLNMQGNVVSAELVNSSGTKLLDKEALATVQRASPFPLPPQERGRNGHIEIVTPIGFYL